MELVFVGLICFVAGTSFGMIVAAFLVMAKDATPDTITDIEARLDG
jgi:hypothetical protein